MKLHLSGTCLPLFDAKAFAAFLRALFREERTVYAKLPFGRSEHVLHYLARVYANDPSYESHPFWRFGEREPYPGIASPSHAWKTRPVSEGSHRKPRRHGRPIRSGPYSNKLLIERFNACKILRPSIVYSGCLSFDYSVRRESNSHQ